MTVIVVWDITLWRFATDVSEELAASIFKVVKVFNFSLNNLITKHMDEVLVQRHFDIWDCGGNSSIYFNLSTKWM
jgi:hypothetical protein